MGPVRAPDEATTVDWDAIGREWQAREDQALRTALADRGYEVVVHRLLLAVTDYLNDDHPTVGDADVVTQIDAAITALLGAARTPADRALAAAFVYLQGLIAWERNSDEARVTALGDGVGPALDRLGVPTTDATLAGHAGGPADPADRVARAAAELAASLRAQVACENALFCSCPATMAHRAAAPREHAGRALAILDDQATGLAGLLLADAQAVAAYYGAVEAMASVTRDLLVDPALPDGDARVADAARVSVAAEQVLQADVLASELRPHREALAALHELAQGPQLRLERGRFTLVYPFALSAVDPIAVLDGMLHVDVDGRRGPASLAGLPATRPEVVDLTGAWRRDVSRRQRYELVQIALPSLAIDRLDGGVTTPVSVRIALSSLGNHSLRFGVDVEELAPHDIDQHIRRLGDQIGTERVRPADAPADGSALPGWDRLLDVATEIVADLRAFVLLDLPLDERDLVVRRAGGADTSVLGTVRPDVDGLDRATALAQLRPIDLLPTAHVVVTCDRLAAVNVDGSRRPVRGDELPRIPGAGALLLPRRGRAASLEDWLRFEVPPIEDVLDGLGRRGDVLHRTAGTTVIAMPGVPDWMVIGYEELAAFAASAAGVLSAWGDRIGEAVSSQAGAFESAIGSGTLDPILARVEELARLNSSVYALLSRLKALNLCNSEEKRILLDRLLRASGFADFEAGLKEHLTSLNAHQVLLSAEADKLIERGEAAKRAAQARRDRIVEGVAFVLALTGLASVFDWLNNGFSLHGRPVVTILQLACLLGFAVLAGWWVLRHVPSRPASQPSNRPSTGEKRDRPDRDAHDP